MMAQSIKHWHFVCFIRKPSVKIVFYIFQCLVAPKKKKKKVNGKLSLVNGKF